MAPHAAIAADTPQIDTAVDSMTASSSSTRKRVASQNADVPDHDHDTERLQKPERARLYHVGEQNRGAHEHETRLDEQLGGTGRPDDGEVSAEMAHQQAEREREDDVFDAPRDRSGMPRKHEREPGQRKHERNPCVNRRTSPP